MNARTYGGTQTTSDHKLVKVEIEINWVKLYKKTKNTSCIKRCNTDKLISDKEVQKRYGEPLDKDVDSMTKNGAAGRWKHIQKAIKKTAEKVIGYKQKKNGYKSDKQLEGMSVKQKELCMLIEKKEMTDIDQMGEIKRKRKRILKKMKERVQEMNDIEIDKTLYEVEESKDDAKMFTAVKLLKKKRYENPFVHDKDGRNGTNKQKMYDIVKEHFEYHFHKADVEEIDQFKGEPKRLQKPFTEKDIKKVIKTNEKQ